LNASTIFPPHRVTIVGALNVTPDSFSDGGRFVREGTTADVEAAALEAGALVRSGAHVIDIGGESTRPGADATPVEIELARTIRVIEAVAKRFDVPISIDTRKAVVAEAAVAAGACIVNDVSGLSFDPAMAKAIACSDAIGILGHTRGTPAEMQRDPHYHDTLREVGDELAAAIERARAAGLAAERIAIDPGIGFGKRVEDNLALLGRIDELRERFGRPVLVGPSRKGFLGTLTGEPVAQRDPATWAACAVAVFAGADAVRVHDVSGAVRAVSIGRAIRDAARAGGHA